VRTQSLSPVEAIRFAETMRIVATATEDAKEGLRAAGEGRAPQVASPLSTVFSQPLPAASLKW